MNPECTFTLALDFLFRVDAGTVGVVFEPVLPLGENLLVGLETLLVGKASVPEALAGIFFVTLLAFFPSLLNSASIASSFSAK